MAAKYNRFKEFCQRVNDHQVVELYVAISAIQAIVEANDLDPGELAYILGCDASTARQVRAEWASSVAGGRLIDDYMEGGLAAD